ncbi:MAG: AbrB/MazE/SpoVT family DNA-binding domain-containing protein [Panacagrimonas sp.]
MFQSQVSSKGQVVIPKPLRERWGIAEGTVVSFSEDARGLHLQVQRPGTRADLLQSLEEGLGLAAYAGPARSPADLRAGVKAAFQRKRR